MEASNDERLARLRAAHAGGLLASWVHIDDQGRQRLTPLAAYAPEVTARGYDALACPEAAMPGWLALALEMFAQLDEDPWEELVTRFVELAPQLLRLSTERLERLDRASRAVALRAARVRATDALALAAIGRVLVLVDGSARGIVEPEPVWDEAREQAAEAARACARLGESRASAPGAAAACAAAARAGPDARGAVYGTALDGLEGTAGHVAPLVRAWLDAWERACTDE